MSNSVIIGVDPGVTTGIAVWDRNTKAFESVRSKSALGAMRFVETMHRSKFLHLVVFEDARLRTYFGSKGPESLQGAGSIKRDCQLWEEFLGDWLGVPYKAVKPQAGATKWTAAAFARATGWTEPTNEHARDAALLVWGMD